MLQVGMVFQSIMRAIMKSFQVLVLKVFIARNHSHVNKIIVDFSEVRHEN
jgi:hypothetical protein